LKNSIDIVINVLNGEDFIQACLLRLLDLIDKSSNKDISIIIYNNKSIDKTRERILAFKENYSTHLIQYVESEKTMTLGQARNEALKYCKGDWVLFHDVDDQLGDNFFNVFKEAISLTKRDDCSLIFTDVIKSSDFTPPLASPSEFAKRGLQTGITDLSNNKSWVFFADFFPVPISTIINRKYLKGECVFDPRMAQAEDFDIACKLIVKNSKALFFGKIKAKYLIHENNLTKAQWLEGFTESLSIIKNLPNRWHSKAKIYQFWQMNHILYSIKMNFKLNKTASIFRALFFVLSQRLLKLNKLFWRKF
tara:strand:- start:3651 stop:4571 length:921 start_codon:yes stop_codon:yes gene_type:complete